MQEFCDTIERPEGYSEPELLPDGYLIALGALAFIGPIVLGSEWTGEEIAARSSNQRERERQDAYGEPKLPRELNFDIRDPGYREKFETARAALPGKDLKEDEARGRRDRVVEVVRQSLYSRQARSYVLSGDGEMHPIKHQFWCSKDAAQVFDKGAATIEVGVVPLVFTVTGHVLFVRESLASAFDIKAKVGAPARVSSTAAAAVRDAPKNPAVEAESATLPVAGERKGDVKRRIEAVLKKAAASHEGNKTLSRRDIASALTKRGSYEDFQFEAVRQILYGSYPVSKRLGIGGLDTWTNLHNVQKE